MNIQYSKKKEEIRHDPVMENINKVWTYIKENGNRISIVIAVIVVLLMGYQIYSYVVKQNLQKSQDAFGKAMMLYNSAEETKAIDSFKEVVERHKGSLQAAYSAYYLGYIAFHNNQYDQAIPWFEKVLATSKNIGFIRGEALKAIGLSYEAKDENTKAAEYWEKALNEKDIAFDYPSIRWKLALVYQKIGNKEKAVSCATVLANDTLSSEYKRQAENLLVGLQQ